MNAKHKEALRIQLFVNSNIFQEKEINILLIPKKLT